MNHLELQVYKENKLLAPKEIAELLGMSKDRIEKMIKSGELPSRKFSARITKVRLIDVENFINNAKSNFDFDYKL